MAVYPMNQPMDAHHCEQAPTLRLCGGPYVTQGTRRMDIPEGSKRLLVFVALHRSRIERRYAAGALWPIGDDARAAGNLRSALWRLRGAGIDLLFADKWSLGIADDVVVDVHVVTDWAAKLIDGTATDDELIVVPWWVDALDLLPGWYDDWALVERERMRQRVLHALEALSRRLVLVGRCAEAVEAAMLASGAEPLRESAQRVLIEAHLAEGNRIEAVRSYRAYRQLLRRELHVDPSEELQFLLHSAQAPLRALTS
jgi:DNA-binding SARP family transcriptional activator